MINKRILYFKQRYLIFCLIFVIFASIKYVNASEVFGIEKLNENIEYIRNEIDKDNEGKLQQITNIIIRVATIPKNNESFIDHMVQYTDYIKQQKPVIDAQRKSGTREQLKSTYNFIYDEFSVSIIKYLTNKYFSKKIRYTIDEFIKNQKNMFNESKSILNMLESENGIGDIGENIKNRIMPNIGADLDIMHNMFISNILLKEKNSNISNVESYSIQPYENKLDRKIQYNFYSNSQEIPIFITKIEQKGDFKGAQLGGKVTKTSENGSFNYFLKTHQDGNRKKQISRNYSSITTVDCDKVNLKELFIYKLLEKIEIGPKTNFFVNPISKNNLIIATEDIAARGGTFYIAADFKKFQLYTGLFDNTTNEIDNDKNVVRLKSDPSKQISLELLNDLKSKFTRLDLLNRALCLNDVNEGNYGLIKDSNNEYFVKLVDFRAPEDSRSRNYKIDSDDFLFSFLKANGFIYRNDGFIRSVLGNKAENEKITLAYKNLNIFDNITDELLHNTYKEIENFAIQNDGISNKQNAETMGIGEVNPNSPLDNQSIYDLHRYCSDIRKNINLIKEIIKTKYNNLLENIKKDTQK